MQIKPDEYIESCNAIGPFLNVRVPRPRFAKEACRSRV
jgi:hypothetical protein